MIDQKIREILPELIQKIEKIKKQKHKPDEGGGGIKYAYWGIEELVPQVKAAFVELKLYLTSEILRETVNTRPSRNEGTMMHYFMVVQFRLTAAQDGSFIECKVPGEAMDTGDKGANKAWTCALKNFLKHVLMIETERSDPDHSNPELGNQGEGGQRQQQGGQQRQPRQGQVSKDNLAMRDACFALLGARENDPAGKSVWLFAEPRDAVKQDLVAHQADLAYLTKSYQAIKAMADVNRKRIKEGQPPMATGELQGYLKASFQQGDLALRAGDEGLDEHHDSDRQPGDD